MAISFDWRVTVKNISEVKQRGPHVGTLPSPITDEAKDLPDGPAVYLGLLICILL